MQKNDEQLNIDVAPGRISTIESREERRKQETDEMEEEEEGRERSEKRDQALPIVWFPRFLLAVYNRGRPRCWYTPC